MIKKKLFIFVVILLLVFLHSAQASIAKADDLVIQDDGKVVLIITNNDILGESTTPTPVAKTATTAPKANPPQPQNTPAQQTEQKQQSSPQPPSNPATQAPAKTVPLVPPHRESTVQINPPINNDKKVQVTITTQATVPQAPSSATSIKTPATTTTTQINNTANPISSPTSTSPSVAPPSVMTKTVDKIVAQGSNGQPVITIKSDQARQLTIQQGSTQVTTSLPLQINTLTHSLSVPSQNQSATINVLPSEALQGSINQGLLNTQDVNQAKINLTKDTNGINYTMNTQKQGKLFSVFPVQSPVQIILSAQNGKVVKTSQSPLFSILGGFIK